MAKRVLKTALVGGALLALAACNASKNDSISGGSLDDAEKASEALLKTGGNGDDWAGIGYSYDEQRFSPLTDINDKNVGELGIAWFADLEDARGQEATPVVVDGVMYVSHAWSKVDAWDAATGKKLWSFQTGSGIEGQPVTWQQDGVQYIAVTSGYGGVYSIFSGDERLAKVPTGGSLWVFAVKN